MRKRVALYAINLPLIATDYAGLHFVLLHDPSIRDALSIFGTQYLVKSDRTVREIADLVRPFAGGYFLVAEVKPRELAGFVEHDVIYWLRRQPSPRRKAGHAPSPDDIAALPSLENLLPIGRGRGAQMLMSAEPLGTA